MAIDKYNAVLLPFLALMRKELHANSRKGDRPGWLGMDGNTALLEVYWHTAKLSAAVKNNDTAAIIEHAADVANMAMMVLDVKVRIEHAATIAGIPYGDIVREGAGVGAPEWLPGDDQLLAGLEGHYQESDGITVPIASELVLALIARFRAAASGVMVDAPLDKLRRCNLGCLEYGQCKAVMHGDPGGCTAGVEGKTNG